MPEHSSKRYWRLVISDPDHQDVERNDPCPCGSGKKFKKCCQRRKPRRRFVTYDFGKPVSPDEVVVSPHGQVQFFQNGEVLQPLESSVRADYERDVKDPKILYDLPTGEKGASTNPNTALEDFDYIFAIDTNTDTIGEETHSATAATQAFLEPKGDQLQGQYAVVGVWRTKGLSDPESAGWKFVIENLIAGDYLEEDSGVAVVVDAHLDDLQSINRREIDIIDGFYLPEGFTLVYAGERGTDFVGHKLLKASHRAAREALEGIRGQ